MSSIQYKKQHRAPKDTHSNASFTCIDCGMYVFPIRLADEVCLGVFPPKKVRVTVTFDCVGLTHADAQKLAIELVSITRKIMDSTFQPYDESAGIRNIRIDTEDIE